MNTDSMHIFDRYAPFVDVSTVKEWSAKPLRKAVRVNTLKTSVEAFKAAAVRRGWQLEQVPWCAEGFYVDREDRSNALGRDLLHLLGHFYMQEAASMLPPALLDPQPGESVLDMSAAPGSKTTQMAGMMKNTGVIVASDVQERRLWTLITALYRSGAVNALVVKKVGQWYAKHMTERFDRVLVDAPCTAQGTARKDSDALLYCGPENIGKMARLQESLLEAGVHAAKVGGTIVYSTCTLTPEENEGVVRAILNKFSDQLEPLSPGLNRYSGTWDRLLEDSAKVQRSLGLDPVPMLRLWPQTEDTEGFFAAILRKKAPTKAPEQFDPLGLPAEQLPRGRSNEIVRLLEERYGIPFLGDNEVLFQREDQVLVARQELIDLLFPSHGMTLGLPFCKRLNDGRVRIAHELATLRGHQATSGVLELNEAQIRELLDGKDTTCDAAAKGDMLLLHGGMCIGRGLAKEGILKNALPREVVRVDATYPV